MPRARLGQFTFVMATGIISTAMHNAETLGTGGYATVAQVISVVLFALAVVGYIALTVFTVVGWFTGAGISTELMAEVRADGFTVLAFTAGSGVLAARSLASGFDWAALTFAYIALGSWVILGYVAVIAAFFSATHSRVQSPSATTPSATTPSATTPLPWTHVNGTWFLMVVGTQAVAVAFGALAAATHVNWYAEVAALWWGMGVLILIVMAVLVVARLIIVGLSHDDEVAPYWVLMGAGAISVLAGAEVMGTGSAQRLVTHDVVGTLCLMAWIFGTWLIPLLIVLMIWHARRPGTNSGFRTALWSLVFPIGMYGVASRQLGVAWHVSWLKDLGTWEAWVALAVWVVVFAGMARWWWRWVRARRSGISAPAR
ncbi:tellurite resistance/C4-dicarboxylate transporter family protein [Gordonia aichiensis]|uniref:Tellurite resistance protein permease n=1 Tax=Gordonia aichiensis NBRC 108223 TaxID=1220583 RepID=L7KH76_9ACTN|nr:tellurite resistance/C4-dicarboxylate transporter family protein [Gordonia aichiensis]GAC47307.1 hypothetical protein GOACH_03_03250 [Gordonia aichiensis NBRC 108223]